MKILYIGYSILQAHLNNTFDPKCSLWTWSTLRLQVTGHLLPFYYVTNSEKILICELIKQI